MNKKRLKEISRYLTDLSFIRRNVEDTPEMSNEEIMIRQLLIECLDLKEQNNNLQHKLKEKDKVIDEAIEFIDNYKAYENVYKQVKPHQFVSGFEDILDEEHIDKLLEILKRGKNGNS